MPNTTPDMILRQLEQSRRLLLDLSLRNRLLNYRPSKVRTIEIVDESSQEVFRTLVAEEKAMIFAGLREVDDRDGLFADDEDPGPRLVAPPADPTDRTLNTKTRESSLHLRLLRIATDARTAMEEQGINILFLVLGMLEWYEHDSSEQPRYAPLILVPVQLDRAGTGRFKLRYTGEDLGTNLSLQAKLKHDFDVSIPDLPDAESLDVSFYLDDVARHIRRLNRWKVHSERVVLGFFSYAKYLMYKDLDFKNWPDNRKPHEHRILSALLGGGFAPEPKLIGEDEFLDPHRPPEEVHEVVDADSSQVLTILDANAKRSMVIEGPPGTGKSQTITNLVAEAVAKGQNVLFVAEKMAALEVVKRNLDRVELGCACLEIHSHKTKKKAVLEELKNTFELPRPTNHEAEGQLERLRTARDRLNTYVTALHAPVVSYGVNAYRAIGEIARLKPEERQLPKGNFGELSNCTQLAFERHSAVVEELQAKINEIGVPCQHPFFGCHPVGFLPTDEADLQSEIERALEGTEDLVDAASALAERLQVPAAERIAGVNRLAAAARYVSNAPSGTAEADVPASKWLTDREEIQRVLSVGQRIAALKDEHGSSLTTGAWEAELGAVRGHLVNYGEKWWRFLVSDYRAAIRTLRGLCADKCPRQYAVRLQLVDAILEYQTLAKEIGDAKQSFSALYGGLWKGERSNWKALLRIRDWITGLHEEIARGEFPKEILRYFEGSWDTNGLAQAADDLLQRVSAHETSWAPLIERLKPGPAVFGEERSTSLLRSQLERLRGWNADPSRIQQIIGYNHRRASVEDLGLGSICELADSWEHGGSDLVDAFAYTWFEGIARVAFQRSPELASFSRTSHEAVVGQFRELDRRTLLLNRARVAHAHHQRMPSAVGAGAVGTLLGEFNRRRRHMPIRQLMARCGEVIQSIKPVFMMSPLSVAMYLPQNGPTFDLVVFDEASQIRPEDAFGAVLRGKQIIVVGDSQQMPPTSFFQRMMADVEDEEDDDRLEASAGDMESILKLLRARGAHHRPLRWHYRSHHDSLVAVSNREFYNDRLIVFPSPDREDDDQGLSLSHLPDTVYGRGGSRSNPREATAIAKTVLEHAESRPELSIGVVAFSRPQQDAIQQQLEILRSTSPSLQHLETLPPHDRLFVKNLENVQGDERDVILISVGYGKDENGFLSHNFGPVNSDGGERRLNVLITRARRQCRVFSNFQHEDVDLGRTQSRGVKVLKTFLKFAETRDLDTPIPKGSEPESPFEEAVLRELTGLGYDVHCQVGSAGFFIDLAVVDPSRRGRYLLGIECDGATYHSARSARDRDRLREEVLLAKGWTIHRIWSTDWWRNPDTELRRLVHAIEGAKALPDLSSVNRSQVAQRPEADFIERENEESRAVEPITAPDYRIAQLRIYLAGRELHEIPHVKIAEWALDVVRTESPVHEEEVLRRIREAASVGRAGGRIRAAFTSAVRFLSRRRSIVKSGTFLLLPDQDKAPVRSRENAPTGSKRLEYVAPSEIGEAILMVARHSFGIDKRELIGETTRLLGFSRTTADMATTIGHEVDRLLRDGQLVVQGSRILAAQAS